MSTRCFSEPNKNQTNRVGRVQSGHHLHDHHRHHSLNVTYCRHDMTEKFLIWSY